jgi:hypothetical protein
MISHQPEVHRLIHQERVQRLAAAPRQTVQRRHLPSPRITQRLSGLAVLAPTALDVRQPRLRTRP